MSLQKKTIEFTPGTTASKRKLQIQEAMKSESYNTIIEGYLIKKGMDPIEYGYGDSDLEFADKIEVHFK